MSKKEHKTPEQEKFLTGGYKIDGGAIVPAKKRGRPFKVRNPDFFSQEKKVETCAFYCVVGNVDEVAAKCYVPAEVIRSWQQEPWWAEIQKRIMVEQNDELLGVINKTLVSVMAMMEDRVLNGDCVYYPEHIGKDGNIVSEEKSVRVPIKARDAAQIFTAITRQRTELQIRPTQDIAKSSIEQRLADLAESFKKLTKGTVLDGDCKTITEKS